MTIPPPAEPQSGSVAESAPGPLAEYRRLVLRHPLLDDALASVKRGVAPGLSPQIVLLLGPTGVGKTTLVDSLVRPSDSASVPAIKATCPPPRGPRGYDFSRMHWRLLAEGARSAFPEDHLSPDLVAARLRSGGGRCDGGSTIDEYRFGVLDLIRARSPRAVVLDEAQHMTHVPSARTQADQFDVIKDCVDRTTVPHLLVGTHELSVMVAVSEQVGRRSLVVHFEPYRFSDAVQRDAFQRIFGQLVAALPLSDPKRSWSELGAHLTDIYFGSAGCVGVLKDWLCRGLQVALEEQKTFLDWPLMSQSRLSPKALSSIVEPIRAYRESKVPDLQDIARALDPDFAVSTTRPRPSARPKPGKRKPARDPVGLPASAPA